MEPFRATLYSQIMIFAPAIIYLLALIGCVTWFYYQPGFESVITALLVTAAFLLHLKPRDKKILLAKRITKIGELKSQWHDEKIVTSPNSDHGKDLLEQLSEFLSEIRENNKNSKLCFELNELIVDVKNVQTVQFFLDGGKSINAFWDKGTKLFKEANELVRRI